jgi:uncharacterized protein (UPF0212 family)
MFDDIGSFLLFIPVLRWCEKHEIKYVDYELSFMPQCPKCRDEFIKDFLEEV